MRPTAEARASGTSPRHFNTDARLCLSLAGTQHVAGSRLRNPHTFNGYSDGLNFDQGAVLFNSSNTSERGALVSSSVNTLERGAVIST